MTVESLKRDARRHEQREEWVKALDLYLQAIERQESEDEPEIALHNRVGDLQVRVGDFEGAMANYERAIDLYVAAGLPNNAIAVCRKMIRHDPERPTAYLRMGKIRAVQGFSVDARQNLITYAEMMQARGEPEEAVRSLREFVALVPEDVDTRVFVADLLTARGREAEALVHLVEAYQAAESAGSDEAQAILVRIREIDPDHPIPSAVPDHRSEQDTRMEEAFDGFALATDDSSSDALGGDPSSEGSADLILDQGPSAELGSDDQWLLEDDAPDAVSAAAGENGDVENESDVGSLGSGVDESWLLTDEGTGERAADRAQPEEPTGDEDDVPWTAAPIAWEGGEDEDVTPGSEIDTDLVLESGPADPSEPDADDTDDLAYLGLDGGTLEGLDSTPDSLGDDEAGDGEDLPYLDFDPDTLDGAELAAEDQADGSEPLQVEADGDVGHALPESADSLPGLRALAEGSPDDPGGWRRLGEGLFAAGEVDEGREALERAHRLHADRGELEKGIRVVRELLIHEPHRIDLRQRAVEYARQTNERTLLVEAFLELADGLKAVGEPEKASAVLQQVLEIDPGNLRANDAVRAPSAMPATSEPSVAKAPEAASTDAAEGEYVDLGALVLDEEEERTTRWTVPAEEPSGDEAADFARMLSQFKAKVAENIASDDARAHYDLGAAYKDMGLIQEAIGEFQQALRAQPNHLATFEMLGECFLEMGDADVAIRTLERGVSQAAETEDDLLGIYYWLAKAKEGVGRTDAARDYYERIFSIDINFKDVVERLKALR